MSRLISDIEILKICYRLLKNKKATEIAIFDVRAHSRITRYIVIGTCNSNLHLKALFFSLEHKLKYIGVHPISEVNKCQAGWFVIDVLDIIIHLLTLEIREYYKIDQLCTNKMKVF